MLSAGGRLPDAVLAEVAGLEPRVLRDGLREAVASQIVVLDGDLFSLRHALLREAVYDDLLPGERAELHRALARALEAPSDAEASAAQHAAAIAHHYLAAGDQPAALAASVRAGVAAMEVQAYREGATLFERALELWDRVPDAAGADRDRPGRPARACSRLPLLRRRRPALGHARQAGALADRRRGRAAPRGLDLRADAARALGAAATGGGRRGARPRSRAARRRRAEPRASGPAGAAGEDADGPVALPPRRRRGAPRAGGAGRARDAGRLPRRRDRRPERARRLADGDRRAGRGRRGAAARARPRARARAPAGHHRRGGQPLRRPAPDGRHRGGAGGGAHGARAGRLAADAPGLARARDRAAVVRLRRLGGRRSGARGGRPPAAGRRQLGARPAAATRRAGARRATSASSPARSSRGPPSWRSTRASRSTSACSARCRRSSRRARATSRRPARRSTTRSTGSSSAPTTRCGWRWSPPPD